MRIYLHGRNDRFQIVFLLGKCIVELIVRKTDQTSRLSFVPAHALKLRHVRISEVNEALNHIFILDGDLAVRVGRYIATIQ